MPNVVVTENLVDLCAAVSRVIREKVSTPKSCLRCDHFREDLEACQHKQHSGQRPPARIIAYGCVLFENIGDDIPF